MEKMDVMMLYLHGVIKNIHYSFYTLISILFRLVQDEPYMAGGYIRFIAFP